MLKDFSKEAFDVLILAGQSNGEGTAFGDVSNPYAENDRIWYFNKDGSFQMAQERPIKNSIQGNFSLSFARKYVEEGMLDEGRKLLILRVAVGGTAFSTNHWNTSGWLYLRMMDMIRTVLALNPENRLKALLWHQGESDAINKMTYEYYHEHLTTLINNVRTEFSVPTLPFIAGDFVPLWKSKHEEICAPIIGALKDICKDTFNIFVETDGLESNLEDGCPRPFGWVDDIHFCRRSIYELGERYFAAYKSLLETK